MGQPSELRVLPIVRRRRIALPEVPELLQEVDCEARFHPEHLNVVIPRHLEPFLQGPLAARERPDSDQQMIRREVDTHREKLCRAVPQADATISMTAHGNLSSVRKPPDESLTIPVAADLSSAPIRRVGDTVIRCQVTAAPKHDTLNSEI